MNSSHRFIVWIVGIVVGSFLVEDVLNLVAHWGCQ